MKFRSLMLFAVSLILLGCENEKSDLAEDDLNSVKKDFLDKIFLAEVEEGPFNMHYNIKTVFFSKDLISLFGEINVFVHGDYNTGSVIFDEKLLPKQIK